MDEKLKYRLVGASVILALAVFFLPMILDSEKYRSQIESQIPPIPQNAESAAVEVSPANRNDKAADLDNETVAEQGPLVIHLDESGEQAEPLTPREIPASDNNEQQKQSQQQPAQQAEQQEVKETAAAVARDEPETTNQAATQQDEKPDTKPAVASTDTQAKPQPSDIKSQPEPSSKPANDAASEAELAFAESAWLIQIGSFSNKDNASRLVAKLRTDGYRAYQRVADGYARVYVGPYPVKSEAEKRTPALEQLVGSKVKIIEFDPKQH